MRKIMLTMVLMAVLMMLATAGYALKSSPVECFDISPNPMYKDCEIYVAVSAPMSINIQIQSLDGKVIRDIYSGLVGKDITLYWERTDNWGNYVPDGEYFVVLGFSTRYTSLKKTLILK